MITEDKVTEIFCVADDFCKVFDAQMAKYTFKAVGKRKYHRESLENYLTKSQFKNLRLCFGKFFSRNNSVESRFDFLKQSFAKTKTSVRRNKP